MNVLRWKLHWQIGAVLAVAILLGIVIQLVELQESGFVQRLLGVCTFVGDLFKNVLQMIVVPLIASSIICGVMSLGEERNIGRLSVKVVTYYAFTGLVAILIGLFLVDTIGPGRVDEATAQAIFGQAQTPEGLDQIDAGSGSLWDIVLRMFPPNIIEAATDNRQLLGIIVFSLLFGFFIGKLPEKHREAQNTFWQGTLGVMMLVTNLIIKFTPLGVFGLVTPIVIKTGFAVFEPLFWFVLTVLLGLAFHAFVTLGLMLRFLGRVRPSEHYRTMAPVLLTAFSTASSSATLPLTLETVEKDAGVSNRVASFTLPLGATVNMDGTALYECVVVVFLAQVYGVLQGFEFGFVQQFTVALLALLTSVGVAGIPAASLVAIVIILQVVGLPLEAVGLIWVTDRILDMCRTSVNVLSDTCGAVIIARSEGEHVYEVAEPVRQGSPAG